MVCRSGKPQALLFVCEFVRDLTRDTVATPQIADHGLGIRLLRRSTFPLFRR